jgi:hypothetical protein
MKRCLAIVVLLYSASATAADLPLHPVWRPNPELTPGAINHAITQANIKQNICKKGWSTKSIRPTSSYTTALKRKQLAQYGYAGTKLSLYEEDHLISLELGGHPTDPHNLWPEVWNGPCGAHIKDALENRLHKLVCAGTVTLSEAQHEIATDWIAAYRRYVDHAGCER